MAGVVIYAGMLQKNDAPLTIDVAHPLARDLVVAALPYGNSFINVVNGEIAALGGTQPARTFDTLAGFQFASGSFTFSNSGINASTEDHFVFTLSNWAGSQASTQTVTCIGNDLCFNMPNTGTNKPGFSSVSGGLVVGGYGLTASQTWANGYWFDAANTQIVGFNNSNFAYAAVTGVTPSYAANPTLKIGMGISSNYYLSLLNLVYVFNRRLTTSEFQALHNNPGQIFTRPRLFKILATATGGVTLSPSLFANSNTFYTHVIEQGGGAVELTPSLFTNTNTFYAPTVAAGAVELTPSLFANTNTFYAPVVGAGAVALTPSLFANTNTFYAPTVAAGAVALTPSLFTNTNTFYAPTVAAGAVALTPSLFANTNTFYAPVVGAGAGALTPDLFTNTNTFYAPTVAAGAVALTPSLFANSNTFYAPVVSASGAVTLAPSLFANTNVFYSPTVAAGAVSLTPELFTNTNTFYAPVVGAVANLTSSLFANSNTFYAPVVAAGAVALTPSLFANTNTFYAPVVGAGAVTLTPNLFTNTNTFYAPLVSAGIAVSHLLPELFVNTNTWYEATVANATQPTLNSADLYLISNAVWAHASGVAVERMLLETWGRLGLDPSNPLITGTTSISFGDIVMAMTEATGSVTLTRQ
jgi:hypothetical protein